MAKKTIKAGANKTGAPCPVGEILRLYCETCNESQTVANCERSAEDADACDEPHFRHIYPNTELCVDLKLLTNKPGRVHVGANLIGNIVRDGDDHFTFIEDAVEEYKQVAPKRNLHIFKGKYITLTVRDDDSPRLNFKEVHWTPGFNIAAYALAVMDEVTQALWEYRKGWWLA